MPRKKTAIARSEPAYEAVLTDIIGLLETARRTSARTVNAVMTATYWSVGRRIVEHEQHGQRRAAYGEEMIERLSHDLRARFGRGSDEFNYAREHGMLADENPPVGLILCAQKDAAVARYALEGLPNKVLATEYRMALPEERVLADEIKKTRKELEQRAQGRV